MWWGEPVHVVTGSGFLWVSVTTLCAAVVEEKHPRLTPKPVQTGSGRMCLQLGSPNKAQLLSICVENGCISSRNSNNQKVISLSSKIIHHLGVARTIYKMFSYFSKEEAAYF